LVKVSLQLDGATLLHLELLFQFLNFLLGSRYFPARALLHEPSGLQVLYFSSQALMEVATAGEFLGFSKALGDNSNPQS
jgi:hypothetical protein